MSDLQILFLVLVALYGWECACWVPRGSVGFRTWFGQRFHPAHPSRLLGNQRAGFVFAHPLSPLGTMLVTSQLPASLSPEAVLGFVAPSVNPGSRPPQSGNFYRFDKIQKITTRAKKILIDGEIFLRAASVGLAAHFVDQLNQLKSLPLSKRAKAIQLLVHQALDVKAIEQRYREFQRQTQSLRVITNVLFLYLFILVPVMIWRFGLVSSWPGLLAGLIACTTTIALSFRRRHKQFYPHLEDERFTHFLIILLSPATAIRALDLLSRPLLETYHPLAVAKVLCTERDFCVLAANYLREVNYPARPLCPQSESSAIQAEQEMRSLLKQEVESLIKKAGQNLTELMRPPMPTESACRSYCPRCLAQFTVSTGVCEDCGGVSLIAFAPESATRKS
jgi:hypothetical protein